MRPVNQCARSRLRPRVKHSNVNGIRTLQLEEPMMRALVNFGPLSAQFYAYSSLHNYHSGIYRRLENDKFLTGHAVLIVGYGENERGEKYWIVRNSWGERGYYLFFGVI
jgi:C1A family cysteine protease